jgi:hypothetical protein
MMEFGLLFIGTDFRLVKESELQPPFVYKKIDSIEDKWGNCFVACREDGFLIDDYQIKNEDKVIV